MPADIIGGGRLWKKLTPPQTLELSTTTPDISTTPVRIDRANDSNNTPMCDS